MVFKPAALAFYQNTDTQASVRNSRGRAPPQSLVYPALQVVPIDVNIEPLVVEKVPETIEEKTNYLEMDSVFCLFLQ